jgi:hypothetical protein
MSSVKTRRGGTQVQGLTPPAQIWKRTDPFRQSTTANTEILIFSREIDPVVPIHLAGGGGVLRFLRLADAFENFLFFEIAQDLQALDFLLFALFNGDEPADQVVDGHDVGHGA